MFGVGSYPTAGGYENILNLDNLCFTKFNVIDKRGSQIRNFLSGFQFLASNLAVFLKFDRDAVPAVSWASSWF